MSNMKVINSNGFNEFGGISYTNLNGNSQAMPSQLLNTALPDDGNYQYSTDPSFVAISGSAGQTVLVNGVDGYQISVMSYTSVVDSNSTFQIFSSGDAGRTPLSGPLYLAANGGVSANDNEIMYRTLPGESLVVENLAGNFGGHLAYKIG